MKPAFQCPSCQFRFRADAANVGRRVRCPNPACNTPMVLSAGLPHPGVSIPESAAPSKQGAPSPRTTATLGSQPLTAKPERPPAQVDPTESRAAQRQRRNLMLAGRPPLRNRATSRGRLRIIAAVIPLLLLVAGLGIRFVGQSDAATTVGLQAAGIASSAAEPNRTPSLTAAQLAEVQLTAIKTAEQEQLEKRQRAVEEKVRPYLEKYCYECHGKDSQESGITVHELTAADDFLRDHTKWERVYRMINAGAMPPSDHDPKPEEAVRKEVTQLLYDELYNFDCNLVRHSGRSTLHRLNRAEYNNTIRDLFGLTITPADKFPQDDVGEGFDNIGDVLSVPPLLMEKYLDAAEEVAATVIDTRDFSKGLKQTFMAGQFVNSGNGQTPDVDGEGFAVLATNGTFAVKVNAPSDGRYTIRLEAWATQAGDETAKMGLMIDRNNTKEFEVAGHRKTKIFEETVELKAGEHELAAAFLNDFYAPEAPERRRDRNLAIRMMELTGPEGGAGELWHDTHKKFVTSRPSETKTALQAAADVLRPILYRAFRRPVTDAEVDRFAGLVESTISAQGETYDYGLFVAIQAILVSPDFLFRMEADPAEGQSERNLNDYEIASRLSYFLWSSMPDDELFQAAENKRLLDRQVLRAQIERMLKDPKSASLSRNFAAQWLNLRNLADVRPNPEVFPEFDEALRSSMGRETELLFNTIVSENRSIEEFLSADYTFVNERLAKHYGISGVQGEEFVRVSLAGTQRTGVLTHGSVLTLTSNPGRTSPVKRGKWILENILGQVPPPPPPGVPALEEASGDVSQLSLRERMEIHRKDPGCASCHKTLDPLGMGFENFDAVGRWRDQEAGKNVDASGDLPDGAKFSGPAELISILRGQKEDFYRSFAEKLMTYALGRGLEYYDKCAVDGAVDSMQREGNRFSALVEGIVVSDPFLKRSRTRESHTTTAASP
jgi:hypothetical protein